MVIGGSWRIPVLEGLQDRGFIEELKLDGTYSEVTFEREFESRWSGETENAFFSGEIFDKRRILAEPEFNAKNSKDNSYYVLGVDVGRLNCTTEVCVFKVYPQAQGPSMKSLVNCFSIGEEHFEDQCILLKKIFERYKARTMVLDANGIGGGLLDYLVKSQTDTETGQYYPPFGIENDEEKRYAKFRTQDTVLDAIYVMKANAAINTEIYTTVQMDFRSGKIKLLKSYSDAKNKLMSTKNGQKMSVSDREDLLMPHRMTDVLKEQMMNLCSENEGINIILKQANRKIPKDRFSALSYGLYYIRQCDEKKRKRKNFGLGKLLFFS